MAIYFCTLSINTLHKINMHTPAVPSTLTLLTCITHSHPKTLLNVGSDYSLFSHSRHNQSNLPCNKITVWCAKISMQRLPMQRKLTGVLCSIQSNGVITFCSAINLLLMILVCACASWCCIRACVENVNRNNVIIIVDTCYAWNNFSCSHLQTKAGVTKIPWSKILLMDETCTFQKTHC